MACRVINLGLIYRITQLILIYIAYLYDINFYRVMMVPTVNQICQKLEALQHRAQGHYNNILVRSSTCNLQSLNLGGEDNK
jgi:hypothetical protein